MFGNHIRTETVRQKLFDAGKLGLLVPMVAIGTGMVPMTARNVARGSVYSRMYDEVGSKNDTAQSIVTLHNGKVCRPRFAFWAFGEIDCN